MFVEPYIVLHCSSNNKKSKHVVTYNHQNQEYMVYYYNNDVINNKKTVLENEFKSKNFSNLANIIYYFKTFELLKIYFNEYTDLEESKNYLIEFSIQNNIVILKNKLTAENLLDKINNYICLLLSTIEYKSVC
jgi:hypothetical protein